MADRRTQAVLALAAIGIGAVLYLFLGSPRTKLAPEADARATNTPEKQDVPDSAKNTSAVQDDHDAAATTPVEEIFPGNLELAKIQRGSVGSYKKNFVFPDGEQISITFKNTGVERDSILDLDDGASGEFFERLSGPASEGNGAAAMQLYKSLRACSNKPKTEQELQKAIRSMRTAGIAPSDGRPLEDRIAWFQKAYERCQGVDPVMIEQSMTYLQSSADAGHTRSALRFALSTVDQDPNLAAKYFEAVWKAGDANGAFGLSRVYRSRGAVTHDDAVRVYAYEYVGYVIRLATYDGLPGRVIARKRQRLMSEMAARTLAVSPGIVEEAMLLAKDLIVSNAECCKY